MCVAESSVFSVGDMLVSGTLRSRPGLLDFFNEWFPCGKGVGVLCCVCTSEINPGGLNYLDAVKGW